MDLITEATQTGAEHRDKTKFGSGKLVGVFNWLKAYWALFPLLLLAADFYWILWGNLTAIVVGIVLLGIVGVDVFALKRSTLPTLKRYWPAIAVLAIISLSMYIRLFGYFTPDGETRWPYLRNIDSYFFYRYMDETVNNHGVLPDTDIYRQAPFGKSRADEQLFYFYTYLGSYSYLTIGKLLGETLQEFLAWFPALLASLIVIPMYFIGKALFDRKAGILAAIFMTLSASFMGRSLGGDPDSDAIVMLVFLTSLAVFWVGKKHLAQPRIKNILLYGVLLGAVLAAYAFTWTGVWLSFWLIGGYIILTFVAKLILKWGKIKQAFNIVLPDLKLFAVGWVVYTFIMVPFWGIGAVFSPISLGIGTVSVYKVETGLFPNVDVSIAEAMSGGGAAQVVTSAAGIDVASSVSGIPTALLVLISPFMLAIAGFCYLGYSYYKRRHHLDTLIFMTVWFGGFLLASTIAVRATIFLPAVYAVLSGLILSKLWHIAIGEERTLGA